MMQLESFVKLVGELRRAQSSYFTARKACSPYAGKLFREAISIEKRVDEQLQIYKLHYDRTNGEQTALFSKY